MKDITNMASLLTYLEPAGNKFTLNISLLAQDTSLPEKSIFPFIIVNDSDPFARLIEARVVSDAGSEVKKLFLFVQRDWYNLKKNALWPFSNHDVRDSWQKSFSFYADRKREDQSFILLSKQLDKTGKILQFCSLFYCKATKKYFHPPCPKCGRILQQCEDDSLLKTSGLYPFSTSLKRYMFCSVCDSPDFFSYEMEGSAPSSLKDRQALMKSFAELKKAEESTAFPCIGCHFHEECYEKGNRVLTRIVPFSFYPFYMFAFEAASLNALDFIALISGADFQDAESLLVSNREFGRVASLKEIKQACAGNIPFLFDHDERYFLEILYLKLAFLQEVIQNFRSGGKFIHPDLNPGIEQIWVKFPEQSGLLPYFWNFKTEILGIGSYAHSPILSKPLSDSLFLMGLIWFYTLLTNKRQTMSDVFVYLEKFSSEENVSFEKLMNESVFEPVNIFWDPQGKTINRNWNSFWERSLKLAWSLLTSNLQTVDGVGEKFLQAIQDLRKDIRENLFLEVSPYSVKAPIAVETVSQSTENDAIHEILVSIIRKLQTTISKKKEEDEQRVKEASFITAPEKPQNISKPPIYESIGEPITETVILSSRLTEKEVTIPSVEEKQKSPEIVEAKKAEGELQETLILSVKDLENKKISQTKVTEEFIAETVIISPVKPAPKEAEKTEGEVKKTKMSVEDLLASTVILSSRPSEKEVTIPPAEDIRKTPQTVTPQKAEDEQETVVVSLDNLEHKKKSQNKVTEDLLTETVILKPGEKSKNGTKK